MGLQRCGAWLRRSFAGASRVLACAPGSHVVGRPEDDSSLLVHVSLSDHERGISVGEWAVHFYGSRVWAGKAQDPLFNLATPPAGMSFLATGSVEHLADRCAAWFEDLLARPVSRTEWVHDNRVYATSWDFADTQEGLVRGYDSTCAPPPGLRSSRGHHDRCVLVRGDTEPQESRRHTKFCLYAGK